MTTVKKWETCFFYDGNTLIAGTLSTLYKGAEEPEIRELTPEEIFFYKELLEPKIKIWHTNNKVL